MSHECSQEGDIASTGIGKIGTVPATSLLNDTLAGNEALSRRREVPRLGPYICTYVTNREGAMRAIHVYICTRKVRRNNPFFVRVLMNTI